MIPVELAPLKVATPNEFVVPEPAAVPLSVKLIVLPFTPEPADVSVAESEVVPPKVPEAGLTLRDVLWTAGTLMQRSNESALPWLTVGTIVAVYNPPLVPAGTLTRKLMVFAVVVMVCGKEFGG